MIVRTASSLNVLKFREEQEEQKDFDPKAHAVAVEAARRSLGVASPAASGRDATGRPEFFSRFTHETQELDFLGLFQTQRSSIEHLFQVGRGSSKVKVFFCKFLNY